MQVQCPGRQSLVSVICFFGGQPGVAPSQHCRTRPRPLQESTRGSSAAKCRLWLSLNSTKAMPRVHLSRTNTPQRYLDAQGLPLPRHRQPSIIVLLRGRGSGARATCWAVTHREAAALFTSGRLSFFFFFFLAPRYSLYNQLIVLRAGAAGWSVSGSSIISVPLKACGAPSLRFPQGGRHRQQGII